MPRPPDELVGDGILLVDKPGGLTSHDVVARCRRICGTRKVGHAGTLDPMATGLLVVGVNRATRLLTFLVGCDKTYEATIRLGCTTTTDDADGGVLSVADASFVRDDEIDRAIASLRGEIAQVPSAVSAIKVDGVRAHARVRAGEEVELAARQVRVHRFEVLARRDVELEAGAATDGAATRRRQIDLKVVVDVSSGTYVRALARDLGKRLGVGGHLVALRRTRVGEFDVARAATLPLLEQRRAEAAPGTSGLPLVDLAHAAAAAMPVWSLDAEEARLLGHGVRLPAPHLGFSGPVAACDPAGGLVAVVEEAGARVDVRAVFAST